MARFRRANTSSTASSTTSARTRSTRYRSFRFLVVMLVIFLPIEHSNAQTESPLPSPAPDTKRHLPKKDQPAFLPEGEDPENRLIAPFIRHLAFDQKQFWGEPLRMRWSDAKFLASFAGFTGTMIANDAALSRRVPGTSSQVNRSKSISDYATYSLIGAAGGSYLWGHLTHNDHLRETGFLAGEAALNSTAVTYLFKSVTQRSRPLEGNRNGMFFQGGLSFPSEHSAIAWSVASVVAHEYPGTLTKIAAYGLASTVMLTRVTGKQHFPSEVVVGSALGWYFGRQVYRAHHNLELGGTGWGRSAEDTENDDKVRNPQHMGSPYVPLDSWVYPAVEKLVNLGSIRTAFLSLKPWTRIETAKLVSQAKDTLDVDDGAPQGMAGIERQLEQEFGYELGLLDGKSNMTARIDSIYTRALSISGPALTDSDHLGQTLSDDYGRPFRRGTNGQVGTSLWAAAGPFTVYVRGEYQHAPAAPALSDAVRNVIASRDLVPIPASTPFSGVDRPHLLEGYVAVNVGGWQISAGKQSLAWAPGPGGSLLWSNNVDPVEMVRVVKSDLQLPILGPARVDQFFGMLRGHAFVPHPYIYGQKINFKPRPYLELGFGRTITIGGRGGDPLNFRNFIGSFFGRPVGGSKGSVPGDTHTSMDWIFRVPKVRGYLVFYGELYADDDPLPIQNPSKSAFRPGIFLTRFPGVPNLDLHVEAASTESPGFSNGTNHGNLNYWNQTYRDGYTNEGVLIGNSVGRMGRSIQTRLTYRASPTSAVEFAYKHSTVSADFIPGGGSWQDYQLRYEKCLKPGVYWKNQVQFEHISHYPILFNSSRRNLTAMVELGWTPYRKR